jgi:hypothetical protein
MLEFLRGKVSDRKLRLFAIACCRLVWHLITDERSQEAVAIAEAYADDRASTKRLKAAYKKAWDVKCAAFRGAEIADGWSYESAQAAWAAWAVTEQIYGESMYAIAQEAIRAVTPQQSADMLRHIFGNPFRSVVFDATWFTPTVVGLARSIYADRAFDRLPILADALEEAGCTDADILAHCRGPGPHVRGCWVVDLLLGKE